MKKRIVLFKEVDVNTNESELRGRFDIIISIDNKFIYSNESYSIGEIIHSLNNEQLIKLLKRIDNEFTHTRYLQDLC